MTVKISSEKYVNLEATEEKKNTIGSYVGELQKPRGGGPIFFSAGGPDFSKQGGARGGSLQKFSLDFHRVIQINKKYRKIGHLLL